MPRTLNAVFDKDDFEELKEVKGDRSWPDAILEELRHKRRARWENHQKLRRKKRDLVRELEEIEADGEVLTYQDQV